MVRCCPLALVALSGLATTALAQPAVPYAGGQFRGPSTLQDPYIIPSANATGVAFYSIASNGGGARALPDETFTSLDGLINRLTGIPDGMGGFYLNQTERDAGVISLLVNHEIGSTSGPLQAWGQRGAYVSLWKVRKSDLGVNGVGMSTHNLTVFTPNGTTGALTGGSFATYNAANPAPSSAAMGRFCAGELAAPSAFGVTIDGVEFGTTKRIFLNGEEVGAPGRPMAHIVEDDLSIETPRLGDFSWENSVANPFPQIKTIVAGADDATPGNVYFYVGEKQLASGTGNTVEKAGLVGGKLFGFTIANAPRSTLGTQAREDNTTVLGGNGNPGSTSEGRVESKRFTMIDIAAAQNDRLGNPLPAINIDNFSGANLQVRSDALSIFNMSRPEDIAWDAQDPSKLYILTTNAFGSPTRLWEMKFDDITQPELGGTITVLVDGQRLSGTTSSVTSFQTAVTPTPTGPQAPVTTIEMMDNLGALPNGLLYIQEDVGGNARYGRLWQYDIYKDSVKEIGVSKPALFTSGQPGFLTIDEETSGVFDASDLLGKGWMFLCMQVHTTNSSNNLVQYAQLMAMYVPEALRKCEVDLASPGDPTRPDGELTADDIIAFINAFTAGANAVADFAGPLGARPDGELTADDVIRYIGRFTAGCN
jgi:hypothetical protein